MNRSQQMDEVASGGLNSEPRPGSVRELMVVALPMMASHACETFMIFIDRVFLAQVDTVKMAASLGGGIASYTLMTFFLGLTGYSTALVAQYLGSGRSDRCAVAVTQAAIVALCAYPVILLLRPLVIMVFDGAGIDPAQLAAQKAYFNILIYGTILVLLRTSLSGFFSGIGKTRMVLVASAVAMLANIASNYVLIFGKMGLPAMGIRGAAYGTLIGSSAGLVVLLLAYLSGPNRTRFNILSSLRFDREAMGRLLRFGLPSGTEMLLNLLAFNAIIMAFQAHSQATAAAVAIMFNWNLVAFLPLVGIQVGVMSLVGRYMGAGLPDTAHRVVVSALKTTWIYTVTVSAAFVLLPKYLASVFSPDGSDALFAAALPTAVFMIRLAGVHVITEGLLIVFSGALRGAGDTFWTMCISVGVRWCLAPIVVVLLHWVGAPAEAAWAIMIGAFMVFSGLLYGRYRSGKWREIRVVHAPRPEQAAAVEAGEV